MFVKLTDLLGCTIFQAEFLSIVVQHLIQATIYIPLGQYFLSQLQALLQAMSEKVEIIYNILNAFSHNLNQKLQFWLQGILYAFDQYRGVTRYQSRYLPVTKPIRS